MDSEPKQRDLTHVPLYERVILFNDNEADNELTKRVEENTLNPEQLKKIKRIIVPFNKKGKLFDYQKSLIAEAVLRTQLNQNEHSLPYRIVVYDGAIKLGDRTERGTAGMVMIKNEGTEREKAYILLSMENISRKKAINFNMALVSTVVEEMLHFTDYKQGVTQTRKFNELDEKLDQISEQIEKIKEKSELKPLVFNLVEGGKAHEDAYHGNESVFEEERDMPQRINSIVSPFIKITESIYNS